MAGTKAAGEAAGEEDLPTTTSRSSTPGRLGCGALVAVLLGGGAALGAAWIFRAPLGRALIGTACAPVVAPQLDMIELISVRKKTTAHRVNPEQPLLLSDREMSWVLTEQYHIPVALRAEGATVVVRKPLALDGGVCGDLDFTGEVAVAQGVLTVRPQRVRYGGWPVPVLPGRSMAVDPLALGAEGPAAARLVGAMESLEVRDGTFRVVLSDMRIIP